MLYCTIDGKHCHGGKPYGFRVGMYATVDDACEGIKEDMQNAGNTFGGMIDATNKGRTYQLFKATWEELSF